MQNRMSAVGGHGKRLIVETNMPQGPCCHDRHRQDQIESSVVSIEALLGQQSKSFKRLFKESLKEVLQAE